MQKTRSIPNQPNLNNLPFLSALLEHASITRAGLELGLSQPAASRIVAQLRKQLGDPLLVRTQQGYQLTDYARQLKGQVTNALHLTEALFEPKSFCPAQDERMLKITTTDFGILTVINNLNAELQHLAPKVSVHCQGWASDTLGQLEQGRVDMVLFDESSLPADFHREYLFDETYYLVVRSGHPLEGLNTINDVFKHAHEFTRVVLSYPTGQTFALDDVLDRCGFEPPLNTIAMPYFQSALWFLPTSNAVMAVPSRIFRKFEKELKLTGWPLDMWDEGFKYYLVWHHRSKDEPFHSWMRQKIKNLTLT